MEKLYHPYIYPTRSAPLLDTEFGKILTGARINIGKIYPSECTMAHPFSGGHPAFRPPKLSRPGRAEPVLGVVHAVVVAVGAAVCVYGHGGVVRDVFLKGSVEMDHEIVVAVACQLRCDCGVGLDSI
jgi:hypothetical protein